VSHVNHHAPFGTSLAIFDLVFGAAIPNTEDENSTTANATPQDISTALGDDRAADVTPQNNTTALSGGPATGGAGWLGYPVVSMRIVAPIRRH
jgi:hypothetical protein